IEFKWNSQVKKLLYEESLYGIVLENTEGATEEIKVDGMFVSIGRKPISKLYEGALKVDEAGYIIADESTKTNIPGVFAIGDVRTKALRQIVTAASDGAVAAHFAEEYIESLQ
ncbi:MAG: NAD(P)/FAD-dependent oxidoreductase, partial [Clostridia bacterium]|nr:NAD(P)/FAD-dependent oxidoreductase [Clostridia bacterium]